MTAISSINDYISQFFAAKDADVYLYNDVQTATTATLFTGQNQIVAVGSSTFTFPTLPSGVTAYRVTGGFATSSTLHTLKVSKLIHFGQINLATNAYTQDASMPTLTEGNNSNQTYSGVIATANNTLGANEGNLKITYNANDGTTANTNTAQTVTNSAVANTGGMVKLNTGHWGASVITSAAQSGGSSPTGLIDFWGTLDIGFIMTGWGGQTIPGMKAFHLSNPMQLGAGDKIGTFAIGNSANVVRMTMVGLRIVGDK